MATDLRSFVPRQAVQGAVYTVVTEIVFPYEAVTRRAQSENKFIVLREVSRILFLPNCSALLANKMDDLIDCTHSQVVD